MNVICISNTKAIDHQEENRCADGCCVERFWALGTAQINIGDVFEVSEYCEYDNGYVDTVDSYNCIYRFDKIDFDNSFEEC